MLLDERPSCEVKDVNLIFCCASTEVSANKHKQKQKNLFNIKPISISKYRPIMYGDVALPKERIQNMAVKQRVALSS